MTQSISYTTDNRTRELVVTIEGESEPVRIPMTGLKYTDAAGKKRSQHDAILERAMAALAERKAGQK